MQAGHEQPERASFRDPAGAVFWRDGQVYRRVMEAGRRDFESARDSGLYDDLTKAGQLIPHRDVTAEPGWLDVPGTAYILAPEQLEFVSYPYEWSFSQLRDAALLTLTIQKHALEHNQILKDASAYNIQFHHGKPVLIDTLSFEPYAGQRAWQAYAQFCRHFLAPLALMAQVDVRLSELLRDHIDGVPLDLAARLLPLHRKLHPRLLLHLTLHSASQQRYAHTTVKADATPPRSQTPASGQPGMAKTSLLGLTDSLASTIRSLRLPRRLATEWGHYYTFTNYSDAAAQHKAEVLTKFVRAVQPATVWDMGGNDGRFSRVALAAGAPSAICFDVDPLAVEKNFRQISEHQETNLLPLLLDLTNPSPAIGWANQERQSISQRRKPGTMVLALALIHHLAISNNLPFDRIAEWLSQVGDTLVIEFVPKGDSKVSTLLATRKDIFDQYEPEAFEAAFGRWFELTDKQPLTDSGRVMYLMKARRHG